MAKEDKTKHTLFLRSGDWAYLESVYQQRSVSTSSVVRLVVSKFVDEIRNRERQLPLDELGPLND